MWTPEGKLVRAWPAPQAYDVWVSASGEIFAVGWTKVLRYDSSGRLLGEFTVRGDGAMAITGDNRGVLFVTYLYSNQVDAYRQTGFLLGSYILPSGATPTQPLSGHTFAVAYSDSGHLFVTDRVNHRVLKLAVENPARPVIVKQPQSQTLVIGSTITLSVEATGTPPLTFQWRKNGAVISGATSTTLTLNNATAATEGGYTVVVSNSLGSVTSELAIVSLPAVFVERQLPSTYSAGTKLSVTLQASPPAGASVYAVEDRPPANWVVSQISDGGAYDANNKNVKWGPYFDANPRTLTYVVTPPFGETGAKEFTGMASVNGVGSAIGNDRVIQLASLHPADTNPADSRITLDESDGLRLGLAERFALADSAESDLDRLRHPMRRALERR